MKLNSAVSAVITGGASGLGLATARRLAAHGVKVAIFDFNEQAGEAVAKELGGVFCKVDVTNEEQVDAGFAAVGIRQPSIRVVTDVLDLDISLQGGDFVRADLLQYPRDKRPGSPPVRLFGTQEPDYSVARSGLRALNGRPEPTHLATFTSTANEFRLAPGAGAEVGGGSALLGGSCGQGVVPGHGWGLRSSEMWGDSLRRSRCGSTDRRSR